MSGFSQLLEFLATPEFISADGVFTIVDKAAKDLGFHVYRHYNVRHKNARPFLHNAYTYPEGWVDRYWEADHHINDPIFQNATRTCLPYSWADMTDNLYITPDQQAIFDEAKEFGLREGLSIPIHKPGGDISLLSFSGNLSRQDFRQIWYYHKRKFTLMGLYIANRSLPQRPE